MTLSNNNTITYYSKIGLILLVLYPLLFPIDRIFYTSYTIVYTAIVFTNYLIIL